MERLPQIGELAAVNCWPLRIDWLPHACGFDGSRFISGMRNLGTWWLVHIDGTALASRRILLLVPLDAISRTQNSLQARLGE